MVDANWLVFAGTEIINNSRTATYAGQQGMPVHCHCRDLRASLGHAPYTNPANDRAPWYDESAPESRWFHGLVGLEITGASGTTIERDVAEYLGDGGALGSARHATRELTVRAVAMAGTQAALSYGISWLSTVLEGSACATGCSGDTLCVYAACPTRPMLPAGPDDDCVAGTDRPDPNWDPITGGPNGPGGDQLVRRLYDVGVLDGIPADTHAVRVQGGWLAEVEFTLVAGNPWWWRDPAPVFDQATAPDHLDVIRGYDILAEYPCPEPVDCLAESPYCTGENAPWPDEPFPGSDPDDTSLIDPCFPTDPFDAARGMWRVPRSAMGGASSVAPIFELYTGDLPVHRLTLRWYTNPRNRVPTGDLDPCTACAEMTIPWISARTTLTIDTRTRATTVNCRGRGSTASGVTVYGPRGGPYEWPVFDCGTPLVVEMIVLNNSLSPSMTWRMSMAARSGAI